MKILLTGATGFLGRRIAAALLARGHQLCCVSRHPPSHATLNNATPEGGPGAASSAQNESGMNQDAAPGISWTTLDYAHALQPGDWQGALNGCDVVINAAGILRSRGTSTLERLHRDAPHALFEAARRQGVSRIIQVSALGADAHAESTYHLTKKAGDDYLRGLGVPYTILQPSLVFGPEGVSARLFMTMATLPLIAVPAHAGMIQPVHVQDLVAAVLALLERPANDMPAVLAVVGPEPMTLPGYLDRLRAAMGARGRARRIRIPDRLLVALAALGKHIGGGVLSSDTLGMLARGNTADAMPLRNVLGRPPLAPEQFMARGYGQAMLQRARLAWLLPLLRWSIAFVWIFTAAVSAFAYPLADSYALLGRVGVPGALQPLALYGAAALDLLFGVVLMLPRRPRWIWAAQACLVIGYTAIITLRLPEFWLHPYGPLTKNATLLVAMWLLCEMEDRTWTS